MSITNKILQASHQVKRWNGQFLVGHKKSISEHSFEVALKSRNIFNYLTKLKVISPFSIDMGELLEYSLLHDLPEIVTGDVTYIVKRDNPALSKELSNVENSFFKSIDYKLPNNCVKIIVKTADILCVMQEVKVEVSLNNFSQETKDIIYSLLYSFIDKYKGSVFYEKKLLLDCLKYLKETYMDNDEYFKGVRTEIFLTEMESRLNG